MKAKCSIQRKRTFCFIMCAMTCQESSVPQSKELELPREMKQKIKKNNSKGREGGEWGVDIKRFAATIYP